ncbi:hypothetical protein GmRootA79_37200 [Acidovorax sp. A79]
MITLAAANECRALGFADLDEILTREFQCGFDGFRATGYEVDLIEPGRGVFNQVFSKLLADVRCKETGVGIRDGIDLRVHRRQNVGMPMPKT